MPVPLIAEVFGRGFSQIPYLGTFLKIAPLVALIFLLKRYFEGAKCKSERVMHGRVVIVTGGTSGVGAEVVRNLATRGAQIVLLTHHAPTDPFLVDYIEDLRTTCNNEMIYAEQVDLASLHSIRTFATKWVDNAPPRRLDMVVLCANTMTPYWGTPKITSDGLEEEWMVNYVGVFHLLSILSPAIRAQPPDREVRILFSTCSSYIWGTLDLQNTETKASSGSTSNARAKLALMSFAAAFQKHLDAYDRPDKHINNARAIIVDPGWSRTPGTRRWLTGGSLIGLVIYLVSWPVWWLVLKSPEQGAQSYLYAAMEAEFGHGAGGKMVKECREMKPLRPEAHDGEIAKTLWEHTEKQIEKLEKQGAVKRAAEKKEKEGGKKADLAPDAVSKDSAAVNTAKASASGGENTQTSGSRRNRKAK